MSFRKYLSRPDHFKGSPLNIPKIPNIHCTAERTAYFEDFEDIGIRVPPPPRANIMLIRPTDKTLAAEYRRLFIRLDKVMLPGYLANARLNHPELYARIKQAGETLDCNARWAAVKSGMEPWVPYRKDMIRWARLEVQAIRIFRMDIQVRLEKGED